MICRYGAPTALRLATGVFAVACSASAFAAELPEIKLSDANKVPDCATPGRLTAFIEGRNKALEPKFSAIAADYMRIGEQLGIRWDTAFFQMMLETGNLTFTGDVSVEQNNFAGLGATGKKEPGETFPDVATGVQAHLEHLLLYAGAAPENPVAERTRKVKEWGLLDAWQKTIKGPMDYTQLAKKWAPGSRNYSKDIAGVADAFYGGVCKGADPKPEMMALARPAKTTKTAASTAKDAKHPVQKPIESPPPNQRATCPRRRPPPMTPRQTPTRRRPSPKRLQRKSLALTSHAAPSRKLAPTARSFDRTSAPARSRQRRRRPPQTAPPVAEAPQQFKIINAEASDETEAGCRRHRRRQRRKSPRPHHPPPA